MDLIVYTDSKKIQLLCYDTKVSKGTLVGHENLVREISFNFHGDRLCSGISIIKSIRR